MPRFQNGEEGKGKLRCVVRVEGVSSVFPVGLLDKKKLLLDFAMNQLIIWLAIQINDD